jgi:hypothetical protein
MQLFWIKLCLLSLFLAMQTGSLLAQKKVSCSLDELIDFPKCWEMTPEMFEKSFSQKGPKTYKWLTADKSRVKFTRKLYSNAEIDLFLFDQQIKAEEVVVDFRNGKLNLITFSIYNRGDSGPISTAKFKEQYMLCGKAMSDKLKVRPSVRKASKRQGLKTAGYSWNSPLAIALLEHNEGALESQKAEFLRLRIAKKGAKGGLAASMTNTRGGASVRLSSLKAFVEKDKKGNVYVKDLPMVDQGNKGYCVVASVQRLFEYFGIGADMHQIAEVANADPTRGTNTLSMAKELDKIDYRFKTRLKIIAMQSTGGGLTEVDVKKGQYYVGKRLDERKITKAIRDSIDDGLPVLWSLQLGKYPEKPQLNPQTSGGHMRLIIGYNDEEDTIIFSDSWGVGHEFKTMQAKHAYQATSGLFTLKPIVN